MKSKTARAKGQSFERYIAKELTANGFGKAHREVMSGGGFRKGDIYCPNFPFMIEAKNQAVVKINEWVDQSKRETQIGFHDPDKWVLMFKDTRTPNNNPTIYALTDFYQFLQLCKKDSEPLIKEPDRELKFKLEDLKRRSNNIIKKLTALKTEDRSLKWEIEDYKQRIQTIIKELK